MIHRKHIIANRIIYIVKESNNIHETQITGVENKNYIEYENLEEFKQWTLTLKSEDISDKGISERGLRNFKQKIRNKKGLRNRSKIAMILYDF
jgi:hypothetical protein